MCGGGGVDDILLVFREGGRMRGGYEGLKRC